MVVANTGVVNVRQFLASDRYIVFIYYCYKNLCYFLLDLIFLSIYEAHRHDLLTRVLLWCHNGYLSVYKDAEVIAVCQGAFKLWQIGSNFPHRGHQNSNSLLNFALLW